MTVYCAILRAASLLVPSYHRAEWMEEWQSELWYVTGSQRIFCLGAFRDALWVRRNSAPPDVPKPVLESPLRCVLLLSLLAAVSTYFGLHLLARPNIIVANLVVILMALLILPATTSFSLGEYPRTDPFRRWIFLAIKFALVIPIVFFGTFELAPIIASGDIQSHATFISYVLAFRWVLTDQRRRCPVCLRLVANPIRIGQPSQTFLDWYGTEFICLKGHGTLQVPEITSSYTIQRWRYLDPSWSNLFL